VLFGGWHPAIRIAIGLVVLTAGVLLHPGDHLLRGFGGLAGLPAWVTTLMSYLPAKPMIDLVTQALEHSALDWRDLAVLAAWAVGGLLLSVRFFAWDPHRPRHSQVAGAGSVIRSA